MEPTSDLFERVIGALVAAKSPPANERREGPRVAIAGTVRLYRFNASGGLADAEPARVRDLSARGLGLIYHGALAPGTTFVLEMGRGEQTVTALCLAMHCTRFDPDLHRIGAKFLALAHGGASAVAPSLRARDGEPAQRTAQDVRDMIAAIGASGAADDRRRTARLGLALKAQLLELGPDDQPGAARAVQISDVSAGGVAIIDDRPLDVGSQFVLGVTWPEASPASVLCTVRYCRPTTPAGYLIGAQFAASDEPAK